jgi:hypothetical protein
VSPGSPDERGHGDERSYEQNEVNQVTARTYLFDIKAISADLDFLGHCFRGNGGRRVPPVAFLCRQESGGGPNDGRIR